MSNKIFKNYQVNLGMPFQVKAAINFDTIKRASNFATEVETEDIQQDFDQSPEELIEKAREEAELIIKESQFEALRIIETAEKKIAENRMLVEEEARKTGYEDGMNAAQRQYEDILQEAEIIREHVKTEYRDVLKSVESDAVNTILDIAKKVIGIEISFNKEDILYLVKQAFEKCSNKESTILKVAPIDHEYLIANRDKLLSMIDGLGDLEIKKDPSLKEGACTIETPFGSIDAGVQTKMARIEEAFRQVIGK